MKRRFTDAEKWKDKWFRKLPLTYKVVWLFLLDNCDNAGIFEADWEFLTPYVGEEISGYVALELFAGKITQVKEDIYIINDFIEIQQKIPLNPAVAPHREIFRCLQKVGLITFEVTIKKLGKQDHPYFTNINADAYSTLLGRDLTSHPGRDLTSHPGGDVSSDLGCDLRSPMGKGMGKVMDMGMGEGKDGPPSASPKTVRSARFTLNPE